MQIGDPDPFLYVEDDPDPTVYLRLMLSAPVSARERPNVQAAATVHRPIQVHALVETHDEQANGVARTVPGISRRQ